MKDILAFLAIWFKNFQKHTFKVDVTGPGDKKELDALSKDLSRVETGIKGIIKAVSSIDSSEDSAELAAILKKILASTEKKIEFSRIVIPKEVAVSNFPDSPEFPESMEISNLPEFPASVEVSNFPDFPEAKDIVFPDKQTVEGEISVKNQLVLDEVIHGLQTVVDVINELRMEMPKAFSTSVATSSQAAAKNVVYETNHIDDTSVADTVYVGRESKTGDWRISKIDTSATSMVYASATNNSGVSGYSAAWASRSTLTYSLFSSAK